jgi:hypothetical protein
MERRSGLGRTGARRGHREAPATARSEAVTTAAVVAARTVLGVGGHAGQLSAGEAMAKGRRRLLLGEPGGGLWYRNRCVEVRRKR